MQAADESLKLKVTIDVKGEIAYIFLSGRVDEDSDLSGLSSIEQDTIIFDFDKLDGMNSCGIREWIKFINALSDNKNITYSNCPVQIIEQINMIMDFRKKGTEIKSFYAPYYCEECDHESFCLLQAEEVADVSNPPAKNCEKCGSEMEFDYPPEQFFRFLGNR